MSIDEMPERPDDESTDEKDVLIVLLRHGIAEERSAAKADEDRSLTAEGHARMKQIAKGLAVAFPRAQAVYSSPLLRAVQTALWVSKGYRSRIKVNTTDSVVPGAGTDEFAAFVKNLTQRRVIVVGHEPNLTENAMELVGLTGGDMELKKGGGYCIRIHTDGKAELEWVLSPRVLRKLGVSD
ncbi:MAG: SixA phosphatase family protein [Thermoanaerobaculia bacterium]